MPGVFSSPKYTSLLAGPTGYARLEFSLTPDTTAWSRAFTLQPWLTIRGDASATLPVRSIAQDETGWLDLSRYADAGFWVNVAGVTWPTGGPVLLNLEASPVKDERTFKAIAPPLILAPQAANGVVVPYFVRTIRTPITAPLSKYTRWRLSVPTGTTGKWDATFSIRGAGGRSSFFLPTQLAGCLSWLRADLGITLTGSNVTSWADQSGRGNDAVAPAGREPAYNVVGHQIGGQPTLFFDPTGATGTEKILELPSGSLSSLSAIHAFVVHRRVAATETIAKRTGFWHNGTGGGTSAMPGTDGNIYDDFASTTDQNTGPPQVLLSTSQVYEVQSTTSGWQSLLNGKLQYSRLTNIMSTVTPPQLGGNTLWPNYYWGDWAEVILYNRILTVNQRSTLIGYLNGRYSLGAV